MSVQAGVSWALAIPGLIMVLLPFCIPRLRGEWGGRLLGAGIACLFGVFFWLAAYDNFTKPDDGPQYSNPYEEPVDEYGGCFGGGRGC